MEEKTGERVRTDICDINMNIEKIHLKLLTATADSINFVLFSHNNP